MIIDDPMIPMIIDSYTQNFFLHRFELTLYPALLLLKMKLATDRFPPAQKACLFGP